MTTMTLRDARADRRAHDSASTRDKQADGPGRVPRWVALLTLIAGVAYGQFPLEHLLSQPLDAVNGYVSELSAVNQPSHLVYTSADLLAAVLAIVVAVAALTTLRRRPLAVTGWIALALFGLCVIGDSVFPLSCAPNHQSWCALNALADHETLADSIHPITTGGVMVFGFTAIVTLTLAARRYHWWPSLARWGGPLAAAHVVAMLGTLFSMLADRWLGVFERVQIGVLCLILLTIGWALLRRPETARSGGDGGRRRERNPKPNMRRPVAVVVCAGAPALALMVLLGGGDAADRISGAIDHISGGAYSNAVAHGTVAELKQRGISLAGRPECEMPEALPHAPMLITCTATTTTGIPVKVVGTASELESEQARELYVITVDGREVVRQECLGLGCRHDNPSA